MKNGLRLSLIAFALMQTLVGCQPQTLNSLSSDKERYGSTLTFDLNDPAQSRFATVNSIIVKKCASCHADFATFSQAQWISNNYVVGGSPAGSLLFSKMKGSAVGGAADMPPSGTLSQTQLEAFRSWITQL